MTAPANLPADLSEAAFLTTVMDLARWHRWMVNHQRPSQVRPGRYATATSGHVGFPDLVLARDGQLILAELKTTRGRLRPGQPDWAIAIGFDHYRLWRPADWPQIIKELT